jgi:hypothetical protein
VIEEGVHNVLDRHGLGIGPGRPSGVQVILLGEVVVERFIGIIPRSEVVGLAANLLCPDACRMGIERKFGIGLARFGNAASVARFVRHRPIKERLVLS